MLSFGATKLERRRALTGLLFVLPWIIGFVALIFVPMVKSIIYVFSDVSIKSGSIETQFVGMENLSRALFSDPDYLVNLGGSIGNMFLEVPIIIVFSILVASVLNQKFIGRTYARILFFLPVIIASGVIIEILMKSGMNTDIASGQSNYLYQATGIKQILENAGVNAKMVGYLTEIVNKIFDIAWKSGIQIIIFLAAFQSIPKSYYEVCDIEGATRWESFWKVTFPILSPYTLICVVYSIIDNFTFYQNKVMVQIDKFFKGFEYSFSAAMPWIYFLIVLVIVGIVAGLISRKVVYIDD